MTENLLLAILSFIIGIILGGILCYLFKRNTQKNLQKELERIHIEMQEVHADALQNRNRREEAELQNVRLETHNQSLCQKLDEAQNEQQLLNASKSTLEQEKNTLQQTLGIVQNQLATEQEKFLQSQNENRILVEKMQVLSNEQMDLQKQLSAVQTRLQGELQNQSNHETLMQNARDLLSDQFKLLAQKVLDDTGNKFSNASQQNMHTLLKPLHEQLQQFNTLIHNNRDKDARERTELVVELKKLQELNNSLHSEAKNLTDALIGTKNKTQGTWGEMILSSVLAHSGLREGMEFETQVSLSVQNDDGSNSRIQPDVLIKLPENKYILVDAKVSLKAYTRYIQSQTPELSQQAMAEHLSSLRTHIASLSAKKYPRANDIITLDFVLMFVPNEAAYIDALRFAPELLQEGFDKQVLLVCPSTLFVTLKTINNMWRDEHTNKNAQEIAEVAGKMYDKLCGAMEEFERLGDGLKKAQSSYDTAIGRLIQGKGNVLSRAEKMRVLGAKTSKQLPEKWLEAEEIYIE